MAGLWMKTGWGLQSCRPALQVAKPGREKASRIQIPDIHVAPSFRNIHQINRYFFISKIYPQNTAVPPSLPANSAS